MQELKKQFSEKLTLPEPEVNAAILAHYKEREKNEWSLFHNIKKTFSKALLGDKDFPGFRNSFLKSRFSDAS